MVKVVEVIQDIIITFFVIAFWAVISTSTVNIVRGNEHWFSRPNDVPAYLLFSCLIAPLWEELAFRYAAIEIGKKFDLVLPAVCISSILFGWGHGYGAQSVFIQGVYGFIFSWSYLNAKRLPYLVTAVAHMMWNLMFVFLPR